MNQNARAVAHQRIGTDRTTVVEVFQNLERLRHDGVALVAFDVGHKTHAAGVVFIRRVVQTLILQLSFFRSRGHGAILNKFNGTKRILQRSNHANQIKRGQIPILRAQNTD